MTLAGSNRIDGKARPPRTPLYGHPPLDALVERALRLSVTGRTLLGIVGEPGAGKSTFAEQLLAQVEHRQPGLAVSVSMDGFHLAQKVIAARGLTASKGTIETFDADGFLAFLRRTRAETDGTVWWPEFNRDLEDAVAGAIEVAAHHRLVIVDGNFLLSTRDPWGQVKSLLDETWFLDALPEPRRERLTSRYISYGFTHQTARAKALGVDESTSALIRSTAPRADLVLSELG
ncbi:nucleoside/nucleotide kinase family protein [Streptomyces spinosirectus]